MNNDNGVVTYAFGLIALSKWFNVVKLLILHNVTITTSRASP